MNIEKEIEIIGYQSAVFCESAKMRRLYDAIRKHWRLEQDNCEVFVASLFYSIGRIHGIREERAKKRQM